MLKIDGEKEVQKRRRRIWPADVRTGSGIHPQHLFEAQNLLPRFCVPVFRVWKVRALDGLFGYDVLYVTAPGRYNRQAAPSQEEQCEHSKTQCNAP